MRMRTEAQIGDMHVVDPEGGSGGGNRSAGPFVGGPDRAPVDLRQVHSGTGGVTGRRSGNLPSAHAGVGLALVLAVISIPGHQLRAASVVPEAVVVFNAALLIFGRPVSRYPVEPDSWRKILP